MPGGSSVHSSVERGMKNMDWSRIGKIIYISSRGTFYDLLTQTDAVAVGAQAMNNQERVNRVMSLPFDPDFFAGFEGAMNGGCVRRVPPRPGAVRGGGWIFTDAAVEQCVPRQSLLSGTL